MDNSVLAGRERPISDAAVAAGLPRAPVALICLAGLVALLAYITLRVPARERLRLAPLVVIAALLLSTYAFWIYVVYAIAVMPLLRPRDAQLPLLGVALYLIGSSDYWHSDSLPDTVNTISSFKTLFGLLLLLPIAINSLAQVSHEGRVARAVPSNAE